MPPGIHAAPLIGVPFIRIPGHDFSMLCPLHVCSQTRPRRMNSPAAAIPSHRWMKGMHKSGGQNASSLGLATKFTLMDVLVSLGSPLF